MAYVQTFFSHVRPNQCYKLVADYLQKNQVDVAHVWLDETMQARSALPYQGLPSTYFLNKKGEIVAHSLGEIKHEQLEQYLQQIQ